MLQQLEKSTAEPHTPSATTICRRPRSRTTPPSAITIAFHAVRRRENTSFLVGEICFTAVAQNSTEFKKNKRHAVADFRTSLRRRPSSPPPLFVTAIFATHSINIFIVAALVNHTQNLTAQPWLQNPPSSGCLLGVGSTVTEAESEDGGDSDDDGEFVGGRRWSAAVSPWCVWDAWIRIGCGRSRFCCKSLPKSFRSKSMGEGRRQSIEEVTVASVRAQPQPLPPWVVCTAAVEESICKHAKRGMTPSQIGVILRDSHGIAQAKIVTGSKILFSGKGVFGHEDEYLLSNSHHLKDLGLDSLDNVEIVMALEEEFKLEIPDKEADKIDSCALAIEYISNHPMAG
nr:Acyl carrier protein 1, mitochondrial [Ipomoea batatas]